MNFSCLFFFWFGPFFYAIKETRVSQKQAKKMIFLPVFTGAWKVSEKSDLFPKQGNFV
jgi:hypothetical protein